MNARPPMAMLAELTYRCPLSCPYCSNPIEMAGREAEMDTQSWGQVFRQAAAMGVLQLHLSGGEPASRRDLEELVTEAREAGLYSNLITSGIGLTEKRLAELDKRGLDHIQLSLQGVNPGQADWIGGYKGGFARKIQVAKWIGEIGFPLTLNAVVHKQNMADLPEMIDIALDMGARRLEVATVQFHGWADLNRAALMPTREQAREVTRIVLDARERLKGKLVIDYVPADHHAKYPKACMGGWASTGLNITPDGTVLPCHAAKTIPHLEFENAKTTPLAEIWNDSASFNAYRGTEWMPEPCQSCERKTIDWGGCRCQAMAIAGDASATDPVCEKSPLHAKLVARAEADAEMTEGNFTYRSLSGNRYS